MISSEFVFKREKETNMHLPVLTNGSFSALTDDSVDSNGLKQILLFFLFSFSFQFFLLRLCCVLLVSLSMYDCRMKNSFS